ncbi:spermidine N1-acetyltransferase [Salinicoccus roseus]|uniref:spermidine N1-acetyltransferase n=1 Tax=Salinicoccus roseus TaxID=45670 RepID=UPI00230050D7|nr:spermidine N1-acetyltransferase [Salinicoccus roseus]
MKIRALESEDLHFVHELNNEYSIMSYWFEEPYESYGELRHLYDKHLLNESERRFIIEDDGERVGIVELMEINFIHRHCEIQIIVAPSHEGRGYAKFAFNEGVDYAFKILNLHKVYLLVDTQNEKAIQIYKKHGFSIEGELKEHFYTNGQYHNAYMMGLLKKDRFNL